MKIERFSIRRDREKGRVNKHRDNMNINAAERWVTRLE